MERSRHRVLTVAALGVLWLSAPAVAQEVLDEKPKEAPDEERTPLDDLVEVRSGANVDAAQVQEKIDSISDETSELVAQYRTTLKQIDAIDLYNQQMQDLLAAQTRELESLNDQLSRVDQVGRSVTPLMLRMIDSIERFIRLDVPFLSEERMARVADLHKTMKRADVTSAEKFRQIMEAYQVENEYGRTIEAYRGSLQLEGRESTVDFLRFGRIALVYQTLDENEAGVWSQESRSWVPLGSNYRSAIRQGLRIARKQSAPDLIELPLPSPVAARGEES
jgi:hypothetical protein